MPLYLIKARDYASESTRAKRKSLRDEHMTQLYALHATGQIVDAAALLDDDGQMAGSIIFFKGNSMHDVDDYLATEPFARDGVWETIEIQQYRSVQWPAPIVSDAGS